MNNKNIRYITGFLLLIWTSVSFANQNILPVKQGKYTEYKVNTYTAKDSKKFPIRVTLTLKPGNTCTAVGINLVDLPYSYTNNYLFKLEWFSMTRADCRPTEETYSESFDLPLGEKLSTILLVPEEASISIERIE